MSYFRETAFCSFSDVCIRYGCNRRLTDEDRREAGECNHGGGARILTWNFRGDPDICKGFVEKAREPELAPALAGFDGVVVIRPDWNC